jgi:hypothetical protein
MTHIAFGTPRKLPKAGKLPGRVAVLDIAFAGMEGGGFDQVTRPLIEGLGARLAAWVDHHDHDRHKDFEKDPRFVLATKAQHGACPEMIGPELVAATGPVDCILCHCDFDGLASAAKWLRGGIEPYPGCDRDAHAIDTRTGVPSAWGTLFDRALRGRPRDAQLQLQIVRFLENGLNDETVLAQVRAAAEELVPIERETERAAQAYRRYPRRSGGGVALVNIEKGYQSLDKTGLLLLGQELEVVSIVVDRQTVSVAAAFDIGLNFLQLFGLDGGMPTRVSVSRSRLNDILDLLHVDVVGG